MRLFFKHILCLVIFTFSSFGILYANELEGEYIIEVGKLNIGKLYWNIGILENNYKISIKLKDEGLWAALYKFKGEYSAEGAIKDDILIPAYYKYAWLTKNKNRRVEIVFDNGSLSKLDMFPVEKETARINFIGIKGHVDPLSSLLNILMNKNHSPTIDGRRIYTMVVNKVKESNNTITKTILIEDYINIWTDHKRNDLQFIEIAHTQNKKKFSMPIMLKIKLKGIVFKLNKI